MRLIKNFLINNHDKEVLKFGGYTFIIKILGLALNYLVILFITTKFGAEVYGRYSFSLVLSQVIALIFTLGMPLFIIKMLSDNTHFKDVPKTNFLNKAFKITFVIALLISVSLYLLSPKISIHLINDVAYIEYLRTMSFFVIPIMFHEIFLGYFKGKKSFTTHNIFLFILPPILFFLFYNFLQHSYTSQTTLLLSYLSGITIVFVLEIYFYAKEVKISFLKNYKSIDLIKDSVPMMYSGLLLYLLGWTDIFMLEALKSSKEVGIYNTAFKVASLGFIVITAINVVIAPKISELYHKNEIKQLHKLITQTTKIIAISTLPIAFVLVFFRKYILGFFGDEFIEGESALIFIVIGILFSAVTGTVDQILNMTNNQKILMRIIIVSFVLNILLNYFLIPTYSIEGAAVASLITNLILNLLCIYFIKKKLGFYTFI